MMLLTSSCFIVFVLFVDKPIKQYISKFIIPCCMMDIRVLGVEIAVLKKLCFIVRAVLLMKFCVLCVSGVF